MKALTEHREAMILLKDLIDTADTKEKKDRILAMSSDLLSIWIDAIQE